jgi:hypothetical protein
MSQNTTQISIGEVRYQAGKAMAGQGINEKDKHGQRNTEN